MESFLGWLQQCYTTWMCIWTFEAIDFAFKFIKNPVSKKKVFRKSLELFDMPYDYENIFHYIFISKLQDRFKFLQGL